MSQQVFSVLIQAKDGMSTPVQRAAEKMRGLAGETVRGDAAMVKLSQSLRAQVTNLTRAVAPMAALYASYRAGTAAATGLTRALRETIQFHDDLAARARVLGVTARQYAEMQYIAKRLEVSEEELQRVVVQGDVAWRRAAEGTGRAGAAYQRLGVELDRTKSLMEQLPEIQRAVMAMSPGDRQQALFDIFGRQGDTINRLIVGQRSLAEVRAEFAALGGEITQRANDRINRAADALDRLALARRNLLTAITAEAAPLLARGADVLAQRATQVAPFARGVREALMDAMNPSDASGMRAAAGRMLKEAAQAAVSALGTTVRRLLEAAGLSLLELLRTGLTAMAPTIARAFLDTITPRVNEFLRSVKAKELPMSAQAAYMEQQGRLFDVRAEVQRLVVQSELGDRGESAEARNAAALLPVRVGEMKELERQVQISWSRLAQERQAESDRFWQAVSEGMTRASGRWSEAMHLIGTDVERVHRRLAAVRDYPVLRGFAQGFRQGGPLGASNAVMHLAAQRNAELTERPGDLVRAQSERQMAQTREAYARLRDTFVTLRVDAQQVLERTSVWGRTLAAQFRQLVQQRVAETAQIGQDLRARQLEALGMQGRASEVRMATEHERERAAMVRQLAGAYSQVREQLEDVQALEARRAMFDRAVFGINQRGSDAQTAFDLAAQLRGAMVEAGTMSQTEALTQARVSAVGLNVALQEQARQITLLRVQYPQFGREITTMLEEVRHRIALASMELRTIGDTSAMAGLRRGMAEYREQATNMATVTRDMLAAGVTGVQDLASNLVRAAVEWRDMGRAALESLKMIAMNVVDVATRMLALRAIMGVVGIFAGAGVAAASPASAVSGLTPGVVGPASVGSNPGFMIPPTGALFNAGGVVNRFRLQGSPAVVAFRDSMMAHNARMREIIGPHMYSRGGPLIVGHGDGGFTKDRVLALLAYQEGVVNRRGMAANGASVLAHMNAGGKVAPVGAGGAGGGGGGVHVHIGAITINGGAGASINSQQLAGQIAEAVVMQIARRPDLRDVLRNML